MWREVGDTLVGLAQQRGQDSTALLHTIMKDSITEQAETQKYWLQRLNDMNSIADAISGYIDELASASQELGEKVRTASEEDSGVSVGVGSVGPVGSAGPASLPPLVRALDENETLLETLAAAYAARRGDDD